MPSSAPGPSLVDLLRDLPEARANPPEFLRELVRRHGDVVSIRLGSSRIVVVGHPDLAREVLEAGEDRFARGRGAARAAALLGSGLLVSEGRLHERQRRRMEPLFTHEAVATYADVVVERAARLRDAWSGDAVDVFDAMRDLTADIVIRCLSADVDDREAQRVVRAIATQAAWFWRLFVPFSTTIERIPVRANRELHRARLAVAGSVARQIDRARRRDRERMLATILASPDPITGGTMPDELAAAEAISLLFGGRAGPGTGLAWTWLALSRHPEAEALMHREIDEILGDRAATHADLPRLRFTRMVFAEALRRYPPAWIVKRQAVRDQRLLGHRVPAGAHVLVSPYVVHHDPRFHHDPDRFDPERFAPEQRAAGHPYAYFPFGGGPMGCLGEHFAWMEGPLVLATIAQRWRLRPTSAAEPAFASFITLKPRGGLRMRPEQRDARRTGS